MKMRVALFAGAALLALATQPVAAQTNGWYAGLAGGANWAADGDVSGVPGISSYETDMGWAGLGKVGYGFGDVRIEGELSYRQNDLSGANTSGEQKTWATMANLLYDFNGFGRFVPYVGFGVGLANYAIDGRIGTSNFDDSAWVPAVQGIVGANFVLTDNFLIGADYRYLTGGDAKLNGSLVNSTAKADNSQHTVMVGLTYRFGAPAPKPAPVAAVAPPP
uniref:outer membrane protein n=1 Tax=Ferrovibrio sp. TaxID=1917215 RepID=UPI0035B05FDF